MQRAVRLAFAALVVCSSVACRKAEVTSLEVRRVEPPALERGTPLRVAGNGFPPTGRCAVEFAGETYRPGAALARVELSVPAEVLAADSILLELPPDAWNALGGQGTFAGSLRVACGTPGRALAVSVRRPLRLDLMQPLGRGMAHDRELEARARRMLELVGIEPADREPTSYGVVVGQVSEEGLAHAAGLRPGDRIVRAAGVGVHAIRDLAPMQHQRQLELLVLRPNVGEPASLVLSLVRASDYERVRFEPWSMLFGIAFGVGSLFRSVRARLRRLLLAPARGHSIALERIGLWGGRRATSLGTSRHVAPLPRALLPATVSAAGVLLVCLEPPDFLALRSISLYLGFAALSAALMLMNGGAASSARLRAVAEMLGRMLVLGILIACGCAISGTKALDGIVAEQGGWPWQWAALQKPSLLLAVPLYVAFASELGAATLPLSLEVAGGRGVLGARLLDGAVIGERVVTNIALCALAVVLFAGGWQAPAELAWDVSPARLPGALLFVAKAWACAGMLSHARTHRWAQRLKHRWTALGCGLTVAGTALLLCLEPEQVKLIEAFSARASSLALLMFAIGGLAMRALRRPAIDHGLPAHERRPALTSDH